MSECWVLWYWQEPRTARAAAREASREVEEGQIGLWRPQCQKPLRKSAARTRCRAGVVFTCCGTFRVHRLNL